MSRHFKIMSRHKTKLKGKKLCRDKEILCRDIFQEQQRMKHVATKFLCRDISHSCRDNYKTTSAELCCDRIQEEKTKLCRYRKLQATTKAGEQR